MRFMKGRGLFGAAAAGLAAGVALLARRAGSSSPSVPEPAAPPSGSVTPELLELLQRSRSKLALVRSELRPLVEHLIENALSQEGIRLVVTDGFRSFAQQEALYAQGRTTPGQIVTHARGGQSWHNYGLAVDVAVLDENGKATWPNDDELWLQIGAIGKVLGLRWGGDFPKFKDRPHFELRLPGVGPGISPPPLGGVA